ncbi:hypothetical protein Tco_0909399 [Tanacetum coccineum]|uniref:Uncharacterized protein n=1 Tax=Tanacetum coccineum TaxID=301880 RepID=A0ABQ5CX35_9ASTR
MNPTAASQIALDNALLCSCYPAFLITAGVPKIYMHQFWNTVTKVKDSSSYQFKLDNKKFRVNAEVFCDIPQICPKLHDQPLLYLLPLMKKLCHLFMNSDTQEILSLYVNWSLITCINPREHLQLSSIGAFLGKPQDLINLGCQELKFCGGCITARMWILLNYSGKTLHSRSIITFKRKACPILMLNEDILNSTAYKTYYSYASGAKEPKKETKFKNPTSPKQKTVPVSPKEPTKKHGKAKKDVTSTKKTTTEPKPTKKKTQVRAGRGKGDGTDFESGVPDEQQRKIFGTDEGTGAKLGVPDVPKYASESDKESWGDSGEEEEDDDDTKDDDDNDGNDDGDDNDGNDDDDDDNDDDSDYERTGSDSDENSNLNQSNEEHDEEEEEYVDEFTDKEDDDDNAKEENEEESDDAAELYKDINVNLRKEDVEMPDVD